MYSTSPDSAPSFTLSATAAKTLAIAVAMPPNSSSSGVPISTSSALSALTAFALDCSTEPFIFANAASTEPAALPPRASIRPSILMPSIAVRLTD